MIFNTITQTFIFSCILDLFDLNKFFIGVKEAIAKYAGTQRTQKMLILMVKYSSNVESLGFIFLLQLNFDLYKYFYECNFRQKCKYERWFRRKQWKWVLWIWSSWYDVYIRKSLIINYLTFNISVVFSNFRFHKLRNKLFSIAM